MDKIGDGSRYGLSIHYSDERGNVLETGIGAARPEDPRDQIAAGAFGAHQKNRIGEPLVKHWE